MRDAYLAKDLDDASRRVEDAPVTVSVK
jgi:hypothetical protein